MSLKPSLCSKSILRRLLARAGAYRSGFATAGDIDTAAAAQFDSWLAGGCHAGMDWLVRHRSLRLHPANVLPGVHTVIVAAFPYPAHVGHPLVADYALGADYHRVLRARLEPVAGYLRRECGALARICIDSAPLPERYWAVRAGVGFTGLNGQLYIPGAGAAFHLAEILTTLSLPPDDPVESGCTACGECVRACPAGALRGDGTLDARRCLSYLTIEHRGDLPDGTRLHGRIYGCDACRRACPLTRDARVPEPLPQLMPRPEVCALTRDDYAAITASRWRRLLADTPLAHTAPSRLRRNARSR